jgi:hypothetical protein
MSEDGRVTLADVALDAAAQEATPSCVQRGSGRLAVPVE